MVKTSLDAVDCVFPILLEFEQAGQICHPILSLTLELSEFKPRLLIAKLLAAPTPKVTAERGDWLS